MFWLNAAETWIDIRSVIADKVIRQLFSNQSCNRTSHCQSHGKILAAV